MTSSWGIDGISGKNRVSNCINAIYGRLKSSVFDVKPDRKAAGEAGWVTVPALPTLLLAISGRSGVNPVDLCK